MKKFEKLLNLEDEIITPGRYVKALRKSFNITQVEIQELTGILTTNLSALENGKKEIGLRTARVLGAALGVDPQNILFPVSNKPIPEERELQLIRTKGKALRESKAVFIVHSKSGRISKRSTHVRGAKGETLRNKSIHPKKKVKEG